MMRKLFALICALMMLGACALAEETAAVYTLEDVGMMIALPTDFNIILTSGMAEDDPAFAAIGLTRDAVEQLLASSGIILDAMIYTPIGITHELTVVSVAMPQVENLNGLTEGKDLDDFIVGMRTPYEAQGITITDYALYRTNGHNFIVLMEEVNGRVGIQAVLVEDYRCCTLTLACLRGVVEQSDVEMMYAILDTMSIGE